VIVVLRGAAQIGPSAIDVEIGGPSATMGACAPEASTSASAPPARRQAQPARYGRHVASLAGGGRLRKPRGDDQRAAQERAQATAASSCVPQGLCKPPPPSTAVTYEQRFHRSSRITISPLRSFALFVAVRSNQPPGSPGHSTASCHTTVGSYNTTGVSCRRYLHTVCRCRANAA
jgi:hypothetical protein